MGGGHGTYKPTIILFPFGMIGTSFQKSITLPFTILGIVQFPIYGYLLDNIKKTMTKYFITLIHFLLIILVFLTTNFN